MTYGFWDLTPLYFKDLGWQRDPPVRGAGYEPSDKDSYTFGSLLYTCLAATIMNCKLNKNAWQS